MKFLANDPSNNHSSENLNRSLPRLLVFLRNYQQKELDQNSFLK